MPEGAGSFFAYSKLGFFAYVAVGNMRCYRYEIWINVFELCHALPSPLSGILVCNNASTFTSIGRGSDALDWQIVITNLAAGSGCTDRGAMNRDDVNEDLLVVLQLHFFDPDDFYWKLLPTTGAAEQSGRIPHRRGWQGADPEKTNSSPCSCLLGRSRAHSSVSTAALGFFHEIQIGDVVKENLEEAIAQSRTNVSTLDLDAENHIKINRLTSVCHLPFVHVAVHIVVPAQKRVAELVKRLSGGRRERKGTVEAAVYSCDQ